MFIGTFEYRVDEKGRVPIPPKFRSDELREHGLILFPGAEKCITAYPPSEWQKFSESLISGPIIQSKMRKLNRAIFANAFEADLDSQGRIILPAPLRQYAGIGDEVVVTGENKYLELWSNKEWDSEKADSQAEAWHIIESLERH